MQHRVQTPDLVRREHGRGAHKVVVFLRVGIHVVLQVVTAVPRVSADAHELHAPRTPELARLMDEVMA